jgi:two-component system chemotaxis response regulator CheY
VLEGGDGVEGWNALDTNPDIDMLITDWNMPEMNGLELVKKVRADARFKDLPIIMVTTEGGKAEVITALKAGVNNYIVKPFTPQVLKEKLGAVMGIEG